MNGLVDQAGRALVDIELKADHDGPSRLTATWIDTAFTGDLVLPNALIDELGLPLTGTVSATLADGSKTALKTYRCFVQWFDEWRRLEVVANAGQHPRLGVGLLLGRQLRIDYRSKRITLD
jgi:predicted aspartyl protease